jgi:predicted DNA-binding protein
MSTKTFRWEGILCAFSIREPPGVGKRLEDFSATTKIPEEFFTREIFEEHLAEGEAKSLPLERLDYQKEGERILELHSEVPLFSHNL